MRIQKLRSRIDCSETEVKRRSSCTLKSAATLPASWEQLCPLQFPSQHVCRGSALHLNNTVKRPLHYHFSALLFHFLVPLHCLHLGLNWFCQDNDTWKIKKFYLSFWKYPCENISMLFFLFFFPLNIIKQKKTTLWKNLCFHN